MIHSLHKYLLHFYEEVKVSTGQAFVQVVPRLYVCREKHITQCGVTRVVRRMNKCDKWRQREAWWDSDGPCQMGTHSCRMTGNVWMESSTLGQQKMVLLLSILNISFVFPGSQRSRRFLSDPGKKTIRQQIALAPATRGQDPSHTASRLLGLQAKQMI